MKCTILGCGGSLGVPQLLCDCYVCISDDPKNNRTRSSILIESKNTTILIDVSPDFKQQALRNKIKKIDAYLVTHAHLDHISGIGDTKPFTSFGKLIPMYMTPEVSAIITNNYEYLFKNDPHSIYKPVLKNIHIDYIKEFTVGDIKIQPFRQEHGEINTVGFRFGNIAYSTDFKSLPKESLDKLRNLDLWVVDCLRFHNAPTHSSYEDTMNLIDMLKPKKAILTHMAHELDYNELIRMLPSTAQVVPAYDGMVLNLN